MEDERAATTVSFYCRARAFFAAHGITVDRVITDNGNNYRAVDFTAKVVSLGGRHHRIRPYTPRHNGKVERYNRLMVDEVLEAPRVSWRLGYLEPAPTGTCSPT